MKTLLVVAHPRQSSLTFAVAKAFADPIGEDGHSVEWADLVRERFDPVLMTPDEPDWNDPNKIYSAPVRAEMQRIERNEATVIVFPVWWWFMPAILKGWVDRVWNHGWAHMFLTSRMSYAIHNYAEQTRYCLTCSGRPQGARP